MVSGRTGRTTNLATTWLALVEPQPNWSVTGSRTVQTRLAIGKEPEIWNIPGMRALNAVATGIVAPGTQVARGETLLLIALYTPGRNDFATQMLFGLARAIMKTLLIMLVFFGVLGILMVIGVLLYCAWEFHQATERIRQSPDADPAVAGQED